MATGYSWCEGDRGSNDFTPSATSRSISLWADEGTVMSSGLSDNVFAEALSGG